MYSERGDGDTKKLSFLLGAALRNGDEDQFLTLYDAALPANLPKEKVQTKQIRKWFVGRSSTICFRKCFRHASLWRKTTSYFVFLIDELASSEMIAYISYNDFLKLGANWFITNKWVCKLWINSTSSSFCAIRSHSVSPWIGSLYADICIYNRISLLNSTILTWGKQIEYSQNCSQTYKSWNNWEKVGR